MQIETRNGTTNTYVIKTFRRDGKLQKRYIGKTSDPAVQLLLEDERLTRAHELAYHEACGIERDRDIATSESLEWLSQWALHWKAIRLLSELQMQSKPVAATPSERQLPGVHRFREVCRRAEAGDRDAQRQLDIWIAETPEMLSKVTDMIAITRDYLIQFVGSASAECSMLWQQQIDSKVTELLREAGDDPLSRMYAEVTTLAWLDVMRSSLMPHLAGDDRKRSTYWGSALGRSQRRWAQVSNAFQQHVKHSKKSRSRKPNLGAKKASQPG